jgi:YaiO family outer membrane protein
VKEKHFNKNVMHFYPRICTIKQEFEMKKFFVILCLLIIIRLAPDCIAEALEPLPDITMQSPSTSTIVPTNESKSDSSKELKKNFHLEAGSSYSTVNNNYGQWKSFDLRIKYSGFDSISPSLSVSTQTRKEGTQIGYGFGSYINVNPNFYMIAGIGVAPVKDPKVILYPKLRMDLAGYFSAPGIKGLVLTTGITHFPKQNGSGGDTISVGGIYYGKLIFMGSLNYNISQPDSITSLSGSAGIQYGVQGKYWAGASVGMGRVAYMYLSETPFDVRYKNRGGNIFYSRWLGKNWGISNRLDYQNQVGFYKLFGITMNLFFDF